LLISSDTSIFLKVQKKKPASLLQMQIRNGLCTP